MNRQEELLSARLWRAPRVSVFIFLGVFSGILAAFGLMFLVPSLGRASLVAWLSVAAVLIGLGLMVFGLLAVVLELLYGKTHTVKVARRHFSDVESGEAGVSGEASGSVVDVTDVVGGVSGDGVSDRREVVAGRMHA